jgi:hypothetical protein
MKTETHITIHVDCETFESLLNSGVISSAVEQYSITMERIPAQVNILVEPTSLDEDHRVSETSEAVLSYCVSQRSVE